MTSFQAALQVAQQAVLVLAEWADADLPSGCQSSEKHPAVKRAREILLWSDTSLNCLRLLFDAVDLSPDGKGQDKQHYYPAASIANCDPLIPYPQSTPPTLENLKEQIRETLTDIDQQDWQNLSLLSLILEKFGSCLSFGEPDVALIDMARATGAIAAALATQPEDSELSLVAGDLSGIQKFIYTISSDGALKSLRARSFYLELVTEEVVQQLLLALDLPRTSVIYAGGGNLYLLAAATDKTEKKVQQVQHNFNSWLKDKFQGKVFLALAYLNFKVGDVANKEFAKHWNEVSYKINKQKNRKFCEQINDLLLPRESYGERCRVCHRDDTTDLAQLNPDEDDSVQACSTCREMFHLGSQLYKARVFVRSDREYMPNKLDKLSFQSTYYYLFENKDKIPDIKSGDTLFFLNNWTVNDYRFHSSVPLLLGHYGQHDEQKKNFIRAFEMANRAKGIERVGYLRMDVDNLGKIFAKVLNENQALPKIAGLSRQMSYFFKVYINSLAENRAANLPDDAKSLTCDLDGTLSRPNLLFIYAGGDDLFISGTWNEVVEFAFDIYQSFRAYTGHNPDITLSGGVSIAAVKYPLYQAAKESGKAEEAAKGNGRDSLDLFGATLKWSEWLGTVDIKSINEMAKNNLNSKDKPELLGVLPFVKKLYSELSTSYSRSFVRNLLATAQIQEQMIRDKQRLIDDIKKNQPGKTENELEITRLKEEQEEIRYYLHLPKIAYTLARLPNYLSQGNSPFKSVRTSLKSPYNAPYFRAIATWLELLTR